MRGGGRGGESYNAGDAKRNFLRASGVHLTDSGHVKSDPYFVAALTR